MRVKGLSTIISISFLYLVIGLGYTQVIKGSYYQRLSQNNRIRLIPSPAPRGDILDRNGVILASTRPSFNACAVPQEFGEKSIESLAKILKLSPDEIRGRLKRGRSSPFAPCVIDRDIDRRTVVRLEELRSELPGVIVQVKGLRDYPHRAISSHVLGYLSEIGPEEFRERKKYGYRAQELVGRAGVEERLNQWLKGEDGGELVEVDYRGRLVRMLGSKESVKGKDLHLTIDIRLQTLAWKLLDGRRGAIILMDPNTGEILTMASRPGYDPNCFLDPKRSRERLRILEDPHSPLLNRAVMCQYPPGSTFKVVVALTALEMDKITLATRRYCDGVYHVGGRPFRCWDEDGHGSVNLEEAIPYSCNVFFYQIGLMAGADNLAKMAKYFGYGRPTGIDLPSEAKGLVPTRRWKRLTRGERWYDGETANFSIGQGYMLVTPLQSIRMISAIANGGNLVQPHLVKDPEMEKEARSLDILAKNINIVKEGMTKAVSWEGGTGHNAYVPGLLIAAKTGTAEVEKGRSHSWFVGFCPADAPKIAFIVFLEHGGYGSQDAARIAGELIKGWSNLDKEKVARF